MKRFNNCTLRIGAILLFICSASSMYAQVTIGSAVKPAKAALLDLKDSEASTPPVSVTDVTNVTSTTGGLALPRVQLVNLNTLEPFVETTDIDWINATTSKIKEKHAGLTVYNLTTSTHFKLGTYTWNGSKWMMVGADAALQFFYMPSFNLPINTVAAGITFDLYAEYVKQFTKVGNTTFVSSNNSLSNIPAVYDASKLDFVVTYYDNTVVKVNNISTTGIMNYDVLNIAPDVSSFINIVFVIK